MILNSMESTLKKMTMKKDILGKVIAVPLLRSGDCVSLAKNFWVGPYAKGTLISLPSFLMVMPLNKVPKEIMVLLRISL